jgi:hypothetical protein
MRDAPPMRITIDIDPIYDHDETRGYDPHWEAYLREDLHNYFHTGYNVTITAERASTDTDK